MNRNLRRVLRASSTGQYDVLIFLIVVTICITTIYSLLFGGDSINEIDTALQVATKNCDLEIVKPLVKKNTNTKGSLSISERALRYAAEEGCLEVVKFLLDRENDTNIISRALLYAARGAQLEVVKLLLDSGANPYYKNEDNKGRTAKTMAIKMSLYPINRNSKKPYREIINLLEDAEKKYKSEQLK